MHEVSLVREIQRLVEQEAIVQQFDRVKVVEVSIGATSCVSEVSLRFAFDAVRSGVLQDAKLAVQKVQTHGSCSACGLDTLMTERLTACTACGGLVVARDEAMMRITGLEVV